LYGARVDYSGQLVIAVSQSGATPEIVTVLERLAGAGARTVAVTNDENSALARAADLVLDLGAGAEVAVPATKTVTAQLVALALLARGLNPATTPFGDADLDELPDLVASVLADERGVGPAADRIAAASMVVAVARGLLYPAALESALKVRESAGLPAEGWSAADLRHGPIAAVQPGAAVVGLSVAGPAEQDTLGLLAELKSRGVDTISVGNAAEADVALPRGNEALAAVPAIVRGQQLALATARRRGVDPDQPFGLSKVTAT
jgi:glucosamine--fructose-6-phosphate aminotransferase (isomerizing)